jgi:hypothetical protein
LEAVESLEPQPANSAAATQATPPIETADFTLRTVPKSSPVTL